jgi:hypothetical protein
MGTLMLYMPCWYDVRLPNGDSGKVQSFSQTSPPVETPKGLLYFILYLILQ